MASKDRFEQHLAECKALRNAYSEAGVAFFEGLMAFEADTESWQAGVDGAYGWPTFAAALRTTELVSHHRYENSKRAVTRFGDVMVRRIGLDAAIELLSVPEEYQPAVQTKMFTFVDEQHKAPALRTAQAMIRGLVPSAPTATAVAKPENAFDRLTRENRELRARVKELESENARLVSECERWRDGQTPGAARKASKQAKPCKKLLAETA
jgi:hypothetical protein